MNQRLRRGILAWVGAGLAGIAALFAAAILGTLYHETLARRPSAPSPGAAVILVLGAAMQKGGALEPNTIRRVDRGVELWHAGAAPKILFSGGRAGWGGPSAAEGMAARAIAAGVDPALVLVETESRSTLQNGLMSRPILAAEAPGPVLVVTEAFHMGRSLLSMRFAGLEIAGHSAVPTLFEHPGYTAHSVLREGAASALNLTRGSVFWLLGVFGLEEGARMPMLVKRGGIAHG